MDTVIEFVDNQVQLDKLLSIGTFLIQGYLYSPPLAGNKIPDFVDKLNKKHINAVSEFAGQQ